MILGVLGGDSWGCFSCQYVHKINNLRYLSIFLLLSDYDCTPEV